MEPFQVSLRLGVAHFLGPKIGLTKISKKLPQPASKLFYGLGVITLAEQESLPAVYQLGFLSVMGGTVGLPRKVGHFLMFFLGVCLWLGGGPLFSVFVL
jgi:hypothetical protein